MSITMTKVFESAMTHPFDLTDMLGKINTHHIMGNLDDAERDALIDLARNKANPAGSVSMEKLISMVVDNASRIAALEKLNGGVSGTTPETGVVAPEEFVVGKWYNNGDRITWKGAVYECCNVPQGNVCTWSPDVYPMYWKKTA